MNFYLSSQQDDDLIPTACVDPNTLMPEPHSEKCSDPLGSDILGEALKVAGICDQISDNKENIEPLRKGSRVKRKLLQQDSSCDLSGISPITQDEVIEDPGIFARDFWQMSSQNVISRTDNILKETNPALLSLLKPPGWISILNTTQDPTGFNTSQQSSGMTNTSMPSRALGWTGIVLQTENPTLMHHSMHSSGQRDARRKAEKKYKHLPVAPKTVDDVSPYGK